MATRFRHRLITAAAALACALAAGPLLAIEQGAFEAGLYTAPGQLFTVKSPLGPSPILVDSFDESTGAVTFLDDKGELYGLICTPNYDVLAGADNDFETDAAILRNWFRDATFPLFFARQLPGASVITRKPVPSTARPPGSQSCTCRADRRCSGTTPRLACRPGSIPYAESSYSAAADRPT